MDLSTGARTRLAFWAKGMVQINDGKMDWPGFSYSEAEWLRLRELAWPISDATYQKFKLINAAVFIALAAVGIFGGFLPLATWLFPVPAETGALKFALLLAGCALFILAIGLPLAMRITSWLVATKTIRAALDAKPGDGDLAAKVSWQINRIIVIMCGFLVPGMLLFITYDIQAGPIVTALKWASIALIGFSVLVSARRRR